MIVKRVAEKGHISDIPFNRGNGLITRSIDSSRSDGNGLDRKLPVVESEYNPYIDERDDGDQTSAREIATKAYHLSMCSQLHIKRH